MDRITSQIESILFVAGEPVLLSELSRGLELTDGELKQKLFELSLSYEAEDRGLRIFLTADSAQLTTAAENADAVEEIATHLKQMLAAGDVILFKASRGIGAERIVEALKRLTAE